MYYFNLCTLNLNTRSFSTVAHTSYSSGDLFPFGYVFWLLLQQKAIGEGNLILFFSCCLYLWGTSAGWWAWRAMLRASPSLTHCSWGGSGCPEGAPWQRVHCTHRPRDALSCTLTPLVSLNVSEMRWSFWSSSCWLALGCCHAAPRMLWLLTWPQAPQHCLQRWVRCPGWGELLCRAEAAGQTKRQIYFLALASTVAYL